MRIPTWEKWFAPTRSVSSRRRSELRVGIPRTLNVWSTHQFWLGFLTALFGFGFGLFLLVRRVIVGSEVEGVFTLFALAFLVMGVSMAGVGMVGEYVGRIYQQVRGRPRFLVRRVHDGKEEP